MTQMIMIPAVSCDAGLYSLVRNELNTIVDTHVLIAAADQMSENVAQILQKAPEKFIVLGTSFGARTALEIALAAPERVQGLVVIGNNAKGPNPSSNQRLERLAKGEFSQVVEEMADRVAYLPGPRGPDTREKFIAMAQTLGPQLLMNQTHAATTRQDREAQLKTITCPSLMIWGDDDQFSPPQEGKDLASAVADGEYHEIAQCGHFPSLEYPDQFTSILSLWLKRKALI